MTSQKGDDDVTTRCRGYNRLIFSCFGVILRNKTGKSAMIMLGVITVFVYSWSPDFLMQVEFFFKLLFFHFFIFSFFIFFIKLIFGLLNYSFNEVTNPSSILLQILYMRGTVPPSLAKNIYFLRYTQYNYYISPVRGSLVYAEAGYFGNNC